MTSATDAPPASDAGQRDVSFPNQPADRGRLGRALRGRGGGRGGPARSERTGSGAIVCASGISPSGPIHLGNLREVMTPHLVADEIRRRGRDVVHLLSWDDYDRFRRVPGRRRPVLGRARRQAADLRARPAGSRVRELGRALQGADARRARRARRRGARRSARPQSTPPARTASRSCSRCASARRIDAILGAVPHQASSRPKPSKPSERRALRRGRRGRRHVGVRVLPVQALLRAAAARTSPRSPAYDDDDHRADLHLRRCGFTETVRLREHTAASWCGRSTGRCAGRTRAWSSSRPASTTHRPGRRSSSAGRSSARSSAASSRSGRCTRSSASAAWPR